MSNVVVAIFKHQQDLTKVTGDLRKMIAQDKVRLTDACGIYRDHRGSIALNQMFQRIDRYFIAGMVGGLLTGFFAGLGIFGFLPAVLTALCGAFAGLVLAAILAMVKDYGLNDDFLTQVGSELENDTTALVLLHAPGSAVPLIHELEKLNATVLQAQFGPREQKDLQERLAVMLHTVPSPASSAVSNNW